jgi:hypothetical protein
MVSPDDLPPLGTAVPLRVPSWAPLAANMPDVGSWVKVKMAGPKVAQVMPDALAWASLVHALPGRVSMVSQERITQENRLVVCPPQGQLQLVAGKHTKLVAGEADRSFQDFYPARLASSSTSEHAPGAADWVVRSTEPEVPLVGAGPSCGAAVAQGAHEGA